MVRRFFSLGVAAVVVAAMLAPLQSQQAPPQGTARQNTGAKKHLALVGGMLIDGYDVPPVHHAAILIEDNKIVAVGPASEVKIPADATIIDTSGRTMLPGLIDEHAHLTILGHGNYNRWYPWAVKNGYLEKVMAISAKQLLDAGITTAVDLGAPLKESIAVRDRINRGEIPGPRMLMSGPWITRSLGNYPPEMNDMQRLIGTPEEAGDGGRGADERGRGRHQSLRAAHAGPLQGDHRRRPQAAGSRARPRVCRDRREKRARERRRRPDARGIGRDRAAVQPADDSGARQCRPARRRHRRAPLVGVSGHGRVPGAAAGSAAQDRLRADSRPVGGSPDLAQRLPGARLFRADRS